MNEQHSSSIFGMDLAKLDEDIVISCPDVSAKELALSSMVADYFHSWHTNLANVMVIIAAENKHLQRLATYLQANTLIQNIVMFEATPFWGANRYLNYNEIQNTRLRTLSGWITRHEPLIVCTTLPALLQVTQKPSFFKNMSLTLECGTEYDMDCFIQDIQNIGYREIDSITERGYFTVRGGIIDVFPSQSVLPIRIEFLGDQIASIRSFELTSQRSKTQLIDCLIAPSAEAVIQSSDRAKITQDLYECLLEQDIPQVEREGVIESVAQGFDFHAKDLFIRTILGANYSSSFGFLKDTDRIICLDSKSQMVSVLEKFLERENQAFRQDAEAKKPTIPPSDFFFDEKEFELNLNRFSRIISFGAAYRKSKTREFTLSSKSLCPVRSQLLAAQSGSDWFSVLKDLFNREVCNLIIVCQNLTHSDHLKSLFGYYQIPYEEVSDAFTENFYTSIQFGKIFLFQAQFSEWLWVNEYQILIIPDFYFSGQKTQKPTPKHSVQQLKALLSSFQDLNPGAYVVHADHGIGVYEGIRALSIGDMINDFLIISYAEQDKVYVPVDKLNLVQKYSDAGAQGLPTIDRLRTQAWAKRKSRVQKAIKDIAAQLLKVQAKRKLSKRVMYSPPSDLYFQFESEFPFDETDDQLRAIDDVNADLSSDLPMDRLICGDVGFGKTEIALRASMRVIQDGWQVLVLAPTTVLSFQHYRTFKDRFDSFGVEVRVLNRFVKTKQINQSIDEFKNGRVDILIGTHRLLSKDIKSKKLGLVIIDEEQRFGVAHKEIIKDMRSGVDILTLTATPIPRSLHMSLLGLRDISVLTTPPKLRLPIKTYVSDFEEDLIKQAIMREIKRGGQVFFVHNRVANIGKLKIQIEQLLPGLHVEVAHGQMKENQLESVMVDFIEQRFPVLLCTTIIESGLDIPNANTIIVNEAENFGLAALYQLRGRVGRSSRQSYAYFLANSTKRLSDDAARRLDLLASHQELGSGFQIASYDLEMRGAGNLLGGEQSGHVADVGVELYTAMVQEEMASLKGEELVSQNDEPELTLGVSVQISHQYIKSDHERLRVYKRLFSAKTIQDVLDERDLVIDRFGEMPKGCDIVFLVAQLKVLLRECKIKYFKQLGSRRFECVFHSLSEKEIAKIISINPVGGIEVKSMPDFSLRLHVREGEGQEVNVQKISAADGGFVFSKVVEFLKIFLIAMRS